MKSLCNAVDDSDQMQIFTEINSYTAKRAAADRAARAFLRADRATDRAARAHFRAFRQALATADRSKEKK